MKELTYLKDLLRAGITPYHLVGACERELLAAGFTELSMDEPWKLALGGRYVVNHHGTTLAAFIVPEQSADLLPTSDHIALRIAAAHTDYPCLRIKAHPDLNTSGYEKINVEVYGGAILSTWLDRPLGVAGRVALTSENPLQPRSVLYDSKRAIATIPNLAIHMNREVNKGVELNCQTDMLPVVGLGENKRAFLSFLAKELAVLEEEILDYDLSLYLAEEPESVGIKEEMLLSPRIDNISSCAAILDAMSTASKEETQRNLLIGICYDHEEIGSRTKQGAGSAILTDLIEKIYVSLGIDVQSAKNAIYQGLMLSADVAHALHPNHVEKADLTNQPIMGSGFAIKEASVQSYATDCEAIAIVEQLAKKAGIPYQKYANRSDIVGGGTLGAISSALLPMRTIDIGIPMLAMHSARELMGCADYESLARIVEELYLA